jgi:hypothetical protein
MQDKDVVLDNGSVVRARVLLDRAGKRLPMEHALVSEMENPASRASKKTVAKEAAVA